MRSLACGLVAGSLLVSGSAEAAESGFGVYLLGSRGGPALGYMPPTGTYFSSESFFYSGEFRGPLSVGSAPPADTKLDVHLAFDLLTPICVTPWKIAGGQLAMAATLPVGYVGVGLETGGARIWDSDTVFGDPSVTVLLGWHHHELHWAIGAATYIAAGAYDVERLANLALNRPAVDAFASGTWLPTGLGLDVSGSVGMTFNAENPATDYRTGTELHLEATVTKSLAHGVSIGAIAYHYEQLTGDSGAGARSGDFKGRVTAAGGFVGYDSKVDDTPVAVRLQVVNEFNVKNRFEGTPAFLTVVVSSPDPTR